MFWVHRVEGTRKREEVPGDRVSDLTLIRRRSDDRNRSRIQYAILQRSVLRFCQVLLFSCDKSRINSDASLLIEDQGIDIKL